MKIGNIDIGEFPLLLAPMEDVSDPPFRVLCKEFGADLLFSEFISSEGLIRNAIKSKKKLDFFEKERPIGIQVFGGDEEAMGLAAKIVEVANPDFIDINFGCPVKKVVCKGAGAGILKDINKMINLTKKVIKNTSLPVTVKTRLGWDEKSINIIEVAEKLQDEGVKSLTIHCRTRSQMYKGVADWEWINKVKESGKNKNSCFGNGDVDSPQKALEYKNKFCVDGIMIGRAAIGYPWIFREIKHFFSTGKFLSPPTLKERIEVCKRHILLSVEWKGSKTGILEMRRCYFNYFKGMDNIKDFRLKLVTADSVDDVFEIFDKMQNFYN